MTIHLPARGAGHGRPSSTSWSRLSLPSPSAAEGRGEPRQREALPQLARFLAFVTPRRGVFLFVGCKPFSAGPGRGLESRLVVPLKVAETDHTPPGAGRATQELTPRQNKQRRLFASGEFRTRARVSTGMGLGWFERWFVTSEDAGSIPVIPDR